MNEDSDFFADGQDSASRKEIEEYLRQLHCSQATFEELAQTVLDLRAELARVREELKQVRGAVTSRTIERDALRTRLSEVERVARALREDAVSEHLGESWDCQGCQAVREFDKALEAKP